MPVNHEANLIRHNIAEVRRQLRNMRPFFEFVWEEDEYGNSRSVPDSPAYREVLGRLDVIEDHVKAMASALEIFTLDSEANKTKVRRRFEERSIARLL